MMALMLRNAIYLFEVYLLATLYDRAAFALRFGEVRRGTPKNCSLLNRATPAQIRSENPRVLVRRIA
jgi:hypothetical protein